MSEIQVGHFTLKKSQLVLTLYHNTDLAASTTMPAFDPNIDFIYNNLSV